MGKTFNDMSDAELGQLLRSRYDRLCDAFDAGMMDEHPSESWARDSEILKAHRAAQDEGGLGPVEIQNKGARDNPPSTPGTPKPPVAGKDSALEAVEDDLIRASGVNVDNRLWEARARRTSGTRVARVAAAIPGYDRLK